MKSAYLLVAGDKHIQLLNKKGSSKGVGGIVLWELCTPVVKGIGHGNNSKEKMLKDTLQTG